jgi:hypothetical protein
MLHVHGYPSPFKISPFARTRPFMALPYDVNLSHRLIKSRPLTMSPITHEAGAVVDRLSLGCALDVSD